MILALGTIIFCLTSLLSLYGYATGVPNSEQSFWFGFGIFMGCVVTQLMWEAYKFKVWGRK